MQRNLAGACVAGVLAALLSAPSSAVAQEDDARNPTAEQTSIHAVQAPPPSDGFLIVACACG